MSSYNLCKLDRYINEHTILNKDINSVHVSNDSSGTYFPYFTLILYIKYMFGGYKKMSKLYYMNIILILVRVEPKTNIIKYELYAKLNIPTSMF
jgi:hypothetical protein